MTEKEYVLRLNRYRILEVILALGEREARVGRNDASLRAACDDVRGQLTAQGAFEDLASWYSGLADDRHTA